MLLLVINYHCFYSDVVHQDEIGEEIEEEDSYLDLAGMKQQTQMNVSRFHSHYKYNSN